MLIDERIIQLLVPSVLTTLYPIIAPDAATTPYTTYLLMNAQNLTTHSAPLPSTRMWRMQFNVYSPTYGAARTIGKTIQDSLVGYTDTFIMGITQMSESGSWDDIAKLFCWMVDLLITENIVA